MVTCDAARRLMARAVDAALDRAAHDRLRAHLWQCGACRTEIEAQLSIRSLLATRPDEPVPDGLGQRLAARLDAASAPRHPVASAATTLAWLDSLNWRTWSLRVLSVTAALSLLAVAAERTDRGGEPVQVAATVDGWVRQDGPVTALLDPEVSDDSLLMALMIRSAAAGGVMEDP